MASSASQHGAEPPEQLACLYKLMDKAAVAGTLCRHARVAELSASAAVQAEALFGKNDSLVVANLRTGKSHSFTSLAVAASGAEQETLFRQAWTVLVSLIPQLLRRVEANTLLLGTVREEELAYYARMLASFWKATNKPIPPIAELRAVASLMGYITLLDAIFGSMNLLRVPFLWPVAQKRMVESFMLQGLDVIPLTAGLITSVMSGEGRLVEIFEADSRDYEPAFYAAVLRKWRSNAVSSVLQARGVLQTGVVMAEQTRKEFEALKRADIAKHGLRGCALPSCSKTENTVKEFAGCSGCRSVVYCCLEHQALDWRAHKKACREKEAARLAAEEEVDDGEKGGGAAAA